MPTLYFYFDIYFLTMIYSHLKLTQSNSFGKKFYHTIQRKNFFPPYKTLVIHPIKKVEHQYLKY